jgi:hypothetical protein
VANEVVRGSTLSIPVTIWGRGVLGAGSGIALSLINSYNQDSNRHQRNEVSIVTEITSCAKCGTVADDSSDINCWGEPCLNVKYGSSG